MLNLAILVRTTQNTKIKTYIGTFWEKNINIYTRKWPRTAKISTNQTLGSLKRHILYLFMIVSMYVVSEGVLAWKSNKPIICAVVGNNVLKCFTVHNLNISLLYLVHLFCLWEIVLYYGSTLFTFFLLFRVSSSRFWLTLSNNSL